MKNKNLGLNHGVWTGTVVSEPIFSHDVKGRSDNEVIDRFYKFEVQVDMVNDTGVVKNSSVLPVTIAESVLHKQLERFPKTGDIVFLKGSWRAYDYKMKDSNKTRVEQTAYIKIIEIHDGFNVRTRNKFEFKGVLVKKLFKPERDGLGKPKFDADGRMVPSMDADGNMEYVVRKNKDGDIVNDFNIAINRPSDSDYIPCIAYGDLAYYVAKKVQIGDTVAGNGYIRKRVFEKNGVTQCAYEAVVLSLKKVKEEAVVESTVKKDNEQNF